MTSRPIDLIRAAVGNLVGGAADLDQRTTDLAAQVEAVKVRVRNDDISPEELNSTLDGLSALAASISGDASEIAGLTSEVAGIEPETNPGS